MTRKIDSVAILGGGTMGSGIAGACAEAGCSVLLLDVTIEAAQKSLDRIVNGRPPAIDTKTHDLTIDARKVPSSLQAHIQAVQGIALEPDRP